MKSFAPQSPFRPLPPDAAGVVSWIHLGDLHMTRAGEQNHLDLAQIVDEVNRTFVDSVSFAYLPGDVADDGSRSAYTVVRGELDRLQVPWLAIVGDHDVHEKSFANFLEAMSERTHSSFTVGAIRFIAMNAFDVPHPASFTVSADQLVWVEQQLRAATDAGQSKVLLLHCYPSDLKLGGGELAELIRSYDVKLIDMGHTHYNEIANDGRTLYTATRSTGQIEEGPVGYSVTNVDGDIVSWRFMELGKLPVVVITSPSDVRLLTRSSKSTQDRLKIRAKFWSEVEGIEAIAHLDGQTMPMKRISNSHVWEVETAAPPDGSYRLKVVFKDLHGKVAEDEIHFAASQRNEQKFEMRDQDNALGAWPEHGLLGTQLGPNKNGKKW